MGQFVISICQELHPMFRGVLDSCSCWKMSDEKAADEVVLNGKEEPKKSAKQDDADKQVEKVAKKDDKEPTQAKLSEAKSVPEPDKAQLKEKFKLFAKFGDKSADGSTIKLSQSDKWFKQAGVIQAKGVSTTDTGIAFRKVAKSSTKLSYPAWSKYIEELAASKNTEVDQIKDKLVNCGPPGTNGATKVAKSTTVDRLTDTTRYGGTHKERFDSSGKGRGKEGRVDAGSDGYVTGYKHKGTYTKAR